MQVMGEKQYRWSWAPGRDLEGCVEKGESDGEFAEEVHMSECWRSDGRKKADSLNRDDFKC